MVPNHAPIGVSRDVRPALFTPPAATMTGNRASVVFPYTARHAPHGAPKSESLRSTNRFSMRITSNTMHKKSSRSGKFRVAALLHSNILASSVTLPLEILTGA